MSCKCGCGCGGEEKKNCGHEHDHNHKNDHNHGHDHDHGGGIELKEVVLLLVSAVLFVVSFLVPDGVSRWVLIAAAAVSGYETVIEAAKSIVKLELDETVLMTIAVIAAFFLGEYSEAAMVAILFKLGEMAEELAVSKSRRSIKALLDIRPEKAVLVKNGEFCEVDAGTVAVGSEIIVRTGDRVPLDAVVLEGSCDADCSALTGESEPRQIGAGDEVLSGMIVIGGSLRCRTTRKFEDSASSKIIEIAEKAQENKGTAEKLISKFAKIYTPLVMALAVLLAVLPPLFALGEFETWIYRALVFLVASCPCALVISIPLTFFSGVGRCSRAGLLLKGSKFINVLAVADSIAFDKTGTLTSGEHRVSAVFAADGRTEAEVIQLAAAVESFSSHPIAKAIIKAADGADTSGIEKVKELPGVGVMAEADGKEILCGGAKMLAASALSAEGLPQNGIYVAENGRVIGCIVTEDVLRSDAKDIICRLRSIGMKRIIMLTGDTSEKAKTTAKSMGITEVFSGLFPAEKVEKVEKLKTTGKGVIYVGDGINDAPVLAAADVGIAVGGGSDAAIEAADAALLAGSLSPLSEAILIARRARLVAYTNIVFALSVKALVLILGALGYAPMWAAIFADVGVMALSVLNAATVLVYRKK
ncbi:MAG: cadmium-translocating P-type ATPase [Oscillospiraceae bacterium]|nr:cadmium-translocating P-type ATPase [Oscillospiraceae bacterium]